MGERRGLCKKERNIYIDIYITLTKRIITANANAAEPINRLSPAMLSSLDKITYKLIMAINRPANCCFVSLSPKNNVDMIITAMGIFAKIIEARPEEIYISPAIINVKGIAK